MTTTLKPTVYGVGINDADYVVQKFEKRKMVWICPYYYKWKKMLERCYAAKWKQAHPQYNDVTTAKEWHLFSTFKKWMIEQNQPLSYQLDKDILVPGNTVYGPDTCILVPRKINNLFVNLTRNKRKGQYSVGVDGAHSNRNLKKKYRAKISYDNVATHIGYYLTEQEAHLAWVNAKSIQFQEVASEFESYPKLSNALMYWSKNLQEIVK